MKAVTSKTAILLVLLSLSVPGILLGNETVSPYVDVMEKGLSTFSEADYQEALEYFRVILSDGDADLYHPDALFWAGKAALAAGLLQDAEKYLENYLVRFPGHQKYPEAFYQKGRLLYMQQEYEAAIEVFRSYIQQYGETVFTANAYYWIGESLFFLGHLDSASRIFSYVVTEYPASYKAEAASYKQSLVHLKKKEQELQKLLKWSHEETIRLLEEFRTREKAYEEALASYQARLAALDDTDLKRQITTLTDSVTALKLQLSARDEEISRLSDELQSYRSEKAGMDSSSSVFSSDAQLGNVRTLLEVKQSALELKARYLELIANTGKGKK